MAGVLSKGRGRQPSSNLDVGWAIPGDGGCRARQCSSQSYGYSVVPATRGTKRQPSRAVMRGAPFILRTN